MTKSTMYLLVVFGVWGCGGASEPSSTASGAGEPPAAREEAVPAPDDGKAIFRHDTFGDEAKWTGELRLHEVIAKGVDPKTALKVGLKVDAEALPPGDAAAAGAARLPAQHRSAPATGGQLRRRRGGEGA